MKKFVFILLALVPYLGLAQQPNNQGSTQDDFLGRYITFKGIELKEGLRMDDMLRMLESKGFKRAETFELFKNKFNGYQLVGSFFNTIECDIKIMPTTNDKNIVGIINVHFPERQTFKQLKEEYDKIKDALNNKYHLNSCEEGFDDEYVGNNTSDYFKLRALQNDECKFKSIYYLSDNPFSLIKGQIVLTISHLAYDYNHDYYVSLLYCTPDNIKEQLSRDDDL